MQPWRKFIRWTPLLLLVMAVCVVIVSGPPEPSYDGKPLSHWLEEYAEEMQNEPPYRATKAADALREMGASAVPRLLKLVLYRQSASSRVGRWLNARQDFVKFDASGDSGRRVAAALAFVPLGSQGNSAVPVLTDAFFDANGHGQFVPALALAGPPDGIPFLLKALTHTNHQVRLMAAWALGNATVDQPRVAGALVDALGDSTYVVRGSSAASLGQLGFFSPDVISSLKDMLEDDHWAVRRNSAHALGKFGPRATNAVAGLMKALEDSQTQVRHAAALALERIQPGIEAVQPIVVETLQEAEGQHLRNIIVTLASSGTTNIVVLAEFQKLAADDSDEQVRATAKWAVERLTRTPTPSPEPSTK